MDMFENYDYIPGTFIPCNSCPPKVDFTNIKRPLEYYNIKGEFQGYTWNYGDSIVLEFNTTNVVVYDDKEFYEDAATYLAGKKMMLDIVDFRYETVYCETKDADVQVNFLIDENSSKRLVKGAYTFRLTLIDEENNVKYTLMPKDDDKCTLFIR